MGSLVISSNISNSINCTYRLNAGPAMCDPISNFTFFCPSTGKTGYITQHNTMTGGDFRYNVCIDGVNMCGFRSGGGFGISIGNNNCNGMPANQPIVINIPQPLPNWVIALFNIAFMPSANCYTSLDISVLDPCNCSNPNNISTVSGVKYCGFISGQS